MMTAFESARGGVYGRDGDLSIVTIGDYYRGCVVGSAVKDVKLVFNDPLYCVLEPLSCYPDDALLLKNGKRQLKLPHAQRAPRIIISPRSAKVILNAKDATFDVIATTPDYTYEKEQWWRGFFFQTREGNCTYFDIENDVFAECRKMKTLSSNIPGDVKIIPVFFTSYFSNS